MFIDGARRWSRPETPEDYAKVDRLTLDVGALNDLSTGHNTFQVSEQIMLDKIPGDFAECGVYTGAQIAIMSEAVHKHGERRTFHLFDSFQGIPFLGEHDDQCAGIPKGDPKKSSGVAVCTLEHVIERMLEFNVERCQNVKYHEGWFCDTVPVSGVTQLALLRLDCDLYHSTKDSLDFLGPKVSKGGWIIIDDWCLAGCNKAVREYWDKSGGEPEWFLPPNVNYPCFWQIK